MPDPTYTTPSANTTLPGTNGPAMNTVIPNPTQLAPQQSGVPSPYTPTGFSINLGNIDSQALAGNNTPSSVMSYRNQLQGQYDQNNPFQQNYNAYIQSALPDQQALAGYTAFSPEELRARQDVLDLQQGQRNAETNILGRTEPLEDQQGQQAQATRQYSNRLSGANATLANLEAIRQNNVAVATALLAQKQANFTNQSGAIKDAQGNVIAVGNLANSQAQTAISQQTANQGRYEFQSITDPNTGFPVIQVVDKQTGSPVTKIDPGSTAGQKIMATGIVTTPATSTVSGGSSYGNQVVSGTTTLMGVSPQDMALPTSEIIKKYGINAVVKGLISQEGGSPKGVVNNPGNIKFVGLPGQIDSGVKATDGGTFASYATPQAGIQAVGQLAERAGQKPLQDFIAAYKGVKLDTGAIQQYGKLANTDFNPNNFVDRAANSYLQTYLKNGEQPSASSIGLANPGVLPQVQKRASDLFTAATGQSLPNLAQLKTANELLSKNKSIINNNEIQAETIKKNFQVVLDSMKSNNINTNATFINNAINPIAKALGDPAVITYLVSNGTLSQELASLIAIKNSGGGTTVADKYIAENLIPPGTPLEAQKQIVARLGIEAINIKDAIDKQNGELYKQIDPLAQEAGNPERNKLVSPEGTDESNIRVIQSFRAASPENDAHAKFLKQQFPQATPLQIRKALNLPAY